MKENHVRIDMDWTSSPVWFGDTGQDFINGSVDELDLTDKTIESLNYYQKLWYKFQPKDSFDPLLTGIEIKDPNLGDFDTLDEYVISLAELVKSELPDKNIYVWDNKNMKNQLITL